MTGHSNLGPRPIRLRDEALGTLMAADVDVARFAVWAIDRHGVERVTDLAVIAVALSEQLADVGTAVEIFTRALLHLDSRRECFQ